MAEMTTMEAIRARHSVRQYEDRALEKAAADRLRQEIAAVNARTGLHVQLVTDEPRAFDGMMAHYGGFGGVTNYLAMIGPKGPDLDETCGYWGEHLVLLAQKLGLNTCWVALTYRRVPRALTIGEGEKLAIVIALGYGKTQGVAHRSKAAERVAPDMEGAPDWYMAGVEAALLAPTAVNQQQFNFVRAGQTVKARAGLGVCSRIDLGIVKYHFEAGAGKEHFTWA